MNPVSDVVRRIPLGAWALLVLALLGGGAAAAAGDPAKPLVLTGAQATYSLTSALTAGTSIEVRNVPADARQLSLLKDYIQRRTDELGPVFGAATAVVSFTNALPADPLYRFARQANLRVVDIDAAIPWPLDMAGVALRSAPRTNVDWAGAAGDAEEASTAPYFWLSLSNAVRMGDIIAHDLAALFPDSAPVIARNLAALRHALLGERDAYQQHVLAGASDVVFALTGDFVYLTNDLGLFVDGYFIKQDVDWTPADLAALTKHLRERGIKVVLHRWQPSDAIQQAVRGGGAQLVVLDPADPGLVKDGKLAADGLQQILHGNLEALQKALAAP
ncbi:MAG: zinc ABC transporter substrate-binding protein [Steroidobacteraceae bacterium]